MCHSTTNSTQRTELINSNECAVAKDLIFVFIIQIIIVVIVIFVRWFRFRGRFLSDRFLGRFLAGCRFGRSFASLGRGGATTAAALLVLRQAHFVFLFLRGGLLFVALLRVLTRNDDNGDDLCAPAKLRRCLPDFLPSSAYFFCNVANRRGGALLLDVRPFILWENEKRR